MKRNERSNALFEQAVRVIPGGVNSPVRAGKSVGVNPPFIAEASGARIWDEDGNAYIDYVGSWGPMILGHRHPEVVEAVRKGLDKGMSYGAPTALEVVMAQTVRRLMPAMEMVRMVNSGTEATMSAIRLARGYTGRDKIVKFDGCYHGHADSLLVSAGSGVATLGIPGSPGVPDVLARNTISLPFNDLGGVETAFDRYGDDIACVIVEPVPGNMGVVVPDVSFLKGLREMTRTFEALLIFDEVISGFRVSLGGAQQRYGIQPDLTCLGKIIGGGLPVGAYGGRSDIMCRMAPEGDIYQAGTLSGNPLAMAAGLATLGILEETDPYAELEQKADRLFTGLQAVAEDAGVAVSINRVRAMGTIFFTAGPVRDFASAAEADQGQYTSYYGHMLDQGIYLAPSAFEATFLSTAHSDDMIEETIDCGARAFRSLG